MSTKLYHGYKINGKKSLADLCAMMASFRKQIIEKADELFAEYAADHVVSVYDRYCVRGTEFLPEEGIGKQLYMSAMLHLLNSITEAKKSEYRNVYDFSCSVTVIPREDDNLAVFHAEFRPLEDVFKAHPDVEFFGYWDDTDPPKEITDEQWKERRSEWEAAFGADWTPSKAGPAFQLMCPEWLNWTSEEFRNLVLNKCNEIPMEFRIKDQATNLYISEYEDEDDDSRELFQKVTEIMRKIESDPTLLDSYRPEIEKKLVPEFTHEIMASTLGE